MKKFLTALIAFVMCFSVVTTAFAATPDEASESNIVSEIRQAMIDTYNDGKEPEYLSIEIVGSTSDGGVCFRYSFGGGIDVIVEETIGDYTYSYNHGDDVMLYKNGNVYSIKEAYESGVIDDSILEELSKMNFGLESNKPNTTVPTEPTTTVATVDEPVTVPDTTSTTSATKPVSTSDTATNDTPNNSQNNSCAVQTGQNSGAVQTGQNSVAVILLVAMLAGCAVIFAKRRNYFK